MSPLLFLCSDASLFCLSIRSPVLYPERGPSPKPVHHSMSSSPLVSRANMDILDELQLIAAQNLERLEVNKYYEVIRELGKGTYGKVDLVIHKIRGDGAMYTARARF